MVRFVRAALTSVPGCDELRMQGLLSPLSLLVLTPLLLFPRFELVAPQRKTSTRYTPPVFPASDASFAVDVVQAAVRADSGHHHSDALPPRGLLLLVPAQGEAAR